MNDKSQVKSDDPDVQFGERILFRITDLQSQLAQAQKELENCVSYRKEANRLAVRSEELSDWHATFPSRTASDVIELLTQARKARDEALASCAVMRDALLTSRHVIGWNYWNKCSDHDCMEFKAIKKINSSIMDTSCGKAFLDRMKEAEWLVANCRWQRYEENREWFERQ